MVTYYVYPSNYFFLCLNLWLRHVNILVLRCRSWLLWSTIGQRGSSTHQPTISKVHTWRFWWDYFISYKLIFKAFLLSLALRRFSWSVFLVLLNGIVHCLCSRILKYSSDNFMSRKSTIVAYLIING